MNYRAALQRMAMVVKVNLAYRWNTIVAQIAPAITALFMIGLLRATDFAGQAVAPASLAAYYCLLSGAVGAMVPAIWPDVFAEIRSGRVIHALVRPFGYVADLVWGGVGSAMYKLASGLLTMGCVALIARPALSLSQLLMFLLLAVPALVLSTLLSTLFSLSAFWLLDDTGPSFFVWYLAMFSSGAILPLRVMPLWAQRAFAALPFRYLIDFPVTASIGMLAPRSVAVGLTVQVIWIGVSALLISLVWSRGLRRLSLGGL